jgi:hypothetical protein
VWGDVGMAHERFIWKEEDVVKDESVRAELEDLKTVIKRHELKIQQLSTAMETAMVHINHLTKKVIVEPAKKEDII